MSDGKYRAMMYRNGVKISELEPLLDIGVAMSINDIYYASIKISRYPSLGITALPQVRTIYDYEIDNDILIYRAAAGLGALPPYLLFFVGKILERKEWEDESGEYITLGIYGLNELLTRRDVDFQAGGSSETLKTDNADDMMKEIVNENMGSGAAAARQFPSANWSEAADVGAASSITFEFPHQNVYDTLLNIAEIAAQGGEGLYFDVVWKNESAIEFRTFLDQLGADTTKTLLFADWRGNIINPILTENYSNEYNLVNAWGSGDPGNQDKSQQEDTERSGRSPWARREYSIQASGDIDSTALASLAKAELRRGRPSLLFECDLLDNHPAAMYGTHWRFGDKVKVHFNGRNYTGLVRTLSAGWNAEDGETSFRGKFIYTSPISAGGTGIP